MAQALTFADHVAELRKRIVWVALVFVIASAAAYSYREAIINVIMAPLHGQKLVYLTPGGGFSFIFQISIYAGLIAAAPVIIYQIYEFLGPALPRSARRSAGSVLTAASVLLLMGIAYGYFVAVPTALTFLSDFAGDTVSPNLTADSYLSFFISYIGGLAALSLTPLVLMFVHWIKPLTPTGLLKSERWIIVLAFVAAAVITPTPDAANQAMIALPVILLYQLGVVSVLAAIYRTKLGAQKRKTTKHDDLMTTTPINRAVSAFIVGITTTAPEPQIASVSDAFVTTNSYPAEPALAANNDTRPNQRIIDIIQPPASHYHPSRQTLAAVPPPPRVLYRQRFERSIARQHNALARASRPSIDGILAVPQAA